ncbi:MAG: hypothetical protein ACTSRS_05470 [Candidatus Helarchaeota archaeon]
MIEKLAVLFQRIELSWCDNPDEAFHTSDKYLELLALVPNLRSIFDQGRIVAPLEFQRTLQHIFRTLKIYFLIKEGRFKDSSLSEQAVRMIQMKIVEYSTRNEYYLPLILLYHDIGRLLDRKTHTIQSSRLIRDLRLFEIFPLAEVERLLLRKIIEYHLLFATIYTGESTFFGILSVLRDPEMNYLFTPQNNQYINDFIDLLEIFTFLDILGYPYSKIFDHYLKYYAEIKCKLKTLLNLGLQSQTVSLAREYSLQWTDWRLAGALRIFQFVETAPHLTAEFYYKVLKESIKKREFPELQRLSWNEIKHSYLHNIYKFQLHYALPFLMILAFGEFKRAKLKERQSISSNLILFWISLSQEITRRNLDVPEAVWHIYFENLPFWSEMNKQFITKLQIGKLREVIRQGTIKYDKKKDEYSFYLNLALL